MFICNYLSCTSVEHFFPSVCLHTKFCKWWSEKNRLKLRMLRSTTCLRECCVCVGGGVVLNKQTNKKPNWIRRYTYPLNWACTWKVAVLFFFQKNGSLSSSDTRLPVAKKYILTWKAKHYFQFYNVGEKSLSNTGFAHQSPKLKRKQTKTTWGSWLQDAA